MHALEVKLHKNMSLMELNPPKIEIKEEPGKAAKELSKWLERSTEI